MKPERLEDQLEQLPAEVGKAIDDAIVLVHCRTGLPLEHIVAGFLGGIVGQTAHLFGPGETAQHCSNLVDQLQVMRQADVDEIARAIPVGRA